MHESETEWLYRVRTRCGEVSATGDHLFWTGPAAWVAARDLVAGMAYLVRRLLENSSNEGFLLRQRHQSLDELLRPPA